MSDAPAPPLPRGDIPDWVRTAFPAVPEADRARVAKAAPSADTSGRRWAILSGEAVAQVVAYDPAGVFPPGAFRPCPPGTLPGDVWDGSGFARPAPALPTPPAPRRVITAPEFLALFTPDEAAAMWAADPALMFGAMTVLAQGTANLDSADLGNLLGLAVAKGVLTRARAERVAAGLPPEAPEMTPTPAPVTEPSPEAPGETAPAPSDEAPAGETPTPSDPAAEPA